VLVLLFLVALVAFSSQLQFDAVVVCLSKLLLLFVCLVCVVILGYLLVQLCIFNGYGKQMAGSMVGHVVADRLFGGGGEGEEGYEQIAQGTEGVLQGPCRNHFGDFLSCVEENENDIGFCQMVFNNFKDCAHSIVYFLISRLFCFGFVLLLFCCWRF